MADSKIHFSRFYGVGITRIKPGFKAFLCLLYLGVAGKQNPQRLTRIHLTNLELLLFAVKGH
jgi:hypothetical protein